MTQPKSVLCHFHLVLALCSSILFSAFLSSSAAYAMPMQANSLHTTGQHSQRAYHCRAYHEVHAGQNLYRISIHYNVNTHILAQVNGIHDINHVPAGQILCIPDLGISHTPMPTQTQSCTPTDCCHTHCPPTSTSTPVPPTPTPTSTFTPTPMPTSTATLVPPTSTPRPTLTPSCTPTDCCPIHCCHTDCCHTDCPPTSTPVSATPTSTSVPPTPTHTPTSIPAPTETPSCTLASCYHTHCCHTHCSPTHETATVTITPTPTVYSPHPGVWHGEYFDNIALSESPHSFQDDPDIHFDWGSGSPDNMPGIADNFSVRWIRIEYFDAGLYHFDVVVDDGIIVWIDDKIVLESWYANPVHYLDVELGAGYHTIRVHYYEHTGDARVALSWYKR